MVPFPDPNKKRKKNTLTGDLFTPAPVTAAGLSQSPTGRKILSQAERDALAKANPGKVISKYGDIKDGSSPEALNAARNRIEAAKASGGTELSATDRAAQEQAQAIRQQQIQAALGQAQATALTPEQAAQQVQGGNIDFLQATEAGLTAATPGLAAAGAGAALSAGGVTSVVGVPIAVASTISAAEAFRQAFNAAKSNVKSQQTQQFAVSDQSLQDGKKYLNAIIRDQNANPQNYDENIAEFQRTLNMIDLAHAKTKKDAQGNLAFWSSNKGQDNIANFEVFDQTLRADYIRRFNEALLNPDPNKATVTEEEMQAYLSQTSGGG